MSYIATVKVTLTLLFGLVAIGLIIAGTITFGSDTPTTGLLWGTGMICLAFLLGAAKIELDKWQ